MRSAHADVDGKREIAGRRRQGGSRRRDRSKRIDYCQQHHDTRGRSWPKNLGPKATRSDKASATLAESPIRDVRINRFQELLVGGRQTVARDRGARTSVGGGGGANDIVSRLEQLRGDPPSTKEKKPSASPVKLTAATVEADPHQRARGREEHNRGESAQRHRPLERQSTEIERALTADSTAAEHGDTPRMPRTSSASFTDGFGADEFCLEKQDAGRSNNDAKAAR